MGKVAYGGVAPHGLARFLFFLLPFLPFRFLFYLFFFIPD
jgi:hypothetical protein